MELYVAGGCAEHGRNCFYVKQTKTSFLVDCGVMKENPSQPYPLLGKKQIAQAKYLFLTHCHADHAGALLWLYENGFRGKVIASSYTMMEISGCIRGAKALERYGPCLKRIRLEKDLAFVWGRSGHCVGSVWYEFRTDDRTILFTGDYCEKSIAYKCDAIRKRHTDISVIDCAYGEEEQDADGNLAALEKGIDEAAELEKMMLFPVPMHGRGLDILRLLFERKIPVYLNPSLIEQVRDLKKEKFWLRKGMRKALKKAEILPLEDLQDHHGKAGILITDSQLSDDRNRGLALKHSDQGGVIILTGKQDPASFSRMMLSSGRAEFLRISVHQNIEEMKRLVKRNSFASVVPFHCRQELKIDDRKYIMLKTGERC